MKKSRENKKERTFRRAIQVFVTGCFLVLLLSCIILWSQYGDYREYADTYNQLVSDYNMLAQAYTDVIQDTVVDNIDGMPELLSFEQKTEIGTWAYIRKRLRFSGTGEVRKKTEDLEKEMRKLADAFLIAQQITAPDTEWVSLRLQALEPVTGVQAVTQENDPNRLLGKQGGYTGCIYFSLKQIDPDQIPGETLTQKGTDCGGCVEIYETREDVQERCEYLEGFDHTLLYSGSYAAVGTMVIRTSYLLTNEQQVEITDEITRALTNL